MKVTHIEFPEFTGKRCLMMPYIQGEPESVPMAYRAGYESILSELVIKKGDIGYLTIDESPVIAGKAQRGCRAKYGRALHTEVGRHPDKVYAWGGGGWGRSHRVELDRNVQILLANNIDNSCAVWDKVHENTSLDGDIGDCSAMYPYDAAIMLKSGDVYQIGILTPHESLPISVDTNRQFIRIVSSGVHGQESYFTKNPLM